MGTIQAALQVLANLTGLAAWWARRKAAQKDDPRNQIQKQKDENREAIANGTGAELLNQRLNRLPDDRKS